MQTPETYNLDGISQGDAAVRPSKRVTAVWWLVTIKQRQPTSKVGCLARA